MKKPLPQNYIIPKAKKNLHSCRYHLDKLYNSKNYEEFEINYSAFVIAARTVTFVLQKQFKGNEIFDRWYGDISGNNPEQFKKGTKQHEMYNDGLCKYFNKIRTSIEKEGINGLQPVTTHITSFNSSEDLQDKLESKDSIVIRPDGIYILTKPNSPQADYIPAKTSAKFSTSFIIKNGPKIHKGKKLGKKTIPELLEIYYGYLKELVEECTRVVN
jgi:hypothetical protein